jgi:hypothetical protein
MEAAGVAIERAPHATWIKRFAERLAALEPARRRRSPEAILSRWARPEREPTRLDTALDAPRVDEQMFHAWLRALLA